MEKMTQLKREFEVIWTIDSWKLLSLMHNKWIQRKNSKREVEKSHRDML